MRITTDHPLSRHGVPVILDDGGNPIDPAEGLARARHRLGLTQPQLAEAVGKSRRTIEDYEQGRRGVPTSVLYVLAGMLEAHAAK